MAIEAKLRKDWLNVLMKLAGAFRLGGVQGRNRQDRY
jgi:hypothetical protein